VPARRPSGEGRRILHRLIGLLGPPPELSRGHPLVGLPRPVDDQHSGARLTSPPGVQTDERRSLSLMVAV